MQKVLLFPLFLLLIGFASAQNKEPKKTAKQVLEELPEMLIAQPDKGTDTLADKLINFNLQLTIPPVWKEKGALIFSDFKLPKADHDPIYQSLPFPDKKLAQGIVITMNTIKKTTAEKKDLVLKDVRAHLTALYKESGEAISAKELDEKVASLVSAPESFTTAEGRKGELYYINDIQSQQSNFVMLLLIPGADGKSSHFVDFRYYRFNYESNIPDDMTEWRMFIYPDEQQAYVDFTKKILSTLIIR
ncbi:MAG: hypothetical protein KIS94_15145 [Chitinophagales bacterium]|nr:hypothetical protein [Chitinophagales bacterium]